MTHYEQVNNWIETVSSHLSNLSKPQARVLALWSFAAVTLQTASMSASALFLSRLFDQKENTLRQRLKEFYKEAPAKKGLKRAQIELSSCHTALVKWVLQLWPSRQLTLALDPTLCRDRFACLCVSLVYEGGSIPLAWKILEANTKGAWLPHWIPLLRHVQVALSSYQVVVLTDRGIFSRTLFAQITELGFHPLMRLNKGATYREKGSTRSYHFDEILPKPGCYYQGKGYLFKEERQIECTFIALWQHGYEEPWYLATDLAQSEGIWYGFRCWIEQGFRCIKSFGMHWERSRIGDPARMERLWLVYALALLWTQAVAGRIAVEMEVELALGMSRRNLLPSQRRRISRFRLGYITILVALIKHTSMPMPELLHPPPRPQLKDCVPIQLGKEQLE